MSEQPPPEPPQSPGAPPSPPPGPYGYAPPQLPTPSNAVTALVLGILAFVMCGPFTAVPAIVIGRKAMREIDASQGQLGGRGMAQAGFVLGIVGTVIGVLALLLVIGVFAFGAVLTTSFEGSCDQVSDGPGSFSVTCD